MPHTLAPALSDRLRELGNIGCGHALTALSKLTRTDFAVRAPQIEMLCCRDMPGPLGNAEDETVSVMLEISGGLKGVFLLLLRPDIAARMLNAIGVPEPQSFRRLEPRQASALLELGNIMCCAYMTAVAEMIDLEIRFSVPILAADMLGAILNAPIIRFAREDTRILYIQTVFTIEGKDWVGSMLLMPELDSATLLNERLGAWL